MKLNEFQELSKRTMPYNGAPANQAEFENMLGNYAMGLVGELMEYTVASTSQDNEATMKEAGDVLHYCVGLLTCIEETVNFEKLYELEFDPIKLTQAMGDILEIPKKHIYHRHDLKKDELLQSIHIVIKGFTETIDKDGISKILETNIDKLKTRYPEKFNTADSINRVDVAANK